MNKNPAIVLKFLGKLFDCNLSWETGLNFFFTTKTLDGRPFFLHSVHFENQSFRESISNRCSKFWTNMFSNNRTIRYISVTSRGLCNSRVSLEFRMYRAFHSLEKRKFCEFITPRVRITYNFMLSDNSYKHLSTVTTFEARMLVLDIYCIHWRRKKCQTGFLKHSSVSDISKNIKT